MNNVKAIQKINEAELRLGLDSKKSWHDMYSDSAYVFIGGLDYNLTEGDVLAVFSQYGEILNINLVRDKKTGKAKGFCFLCYENQKSTVLAVDNINGIKLCGRTIRVDHVSEYRRPKDEDGKEIIEKGCAPKTPTPSPPVSGNESENAIAAGSHKRKKKKKHKERKKRSERGVNEFSSETVVPILKGPTSKSMKPSHSREKTLIRHDSPSHRPGHYTRKEERRTFEDDELLKLPKSNQSPPRSKERGRSEVVDKKYSDDRYRNRSRSRERGTYHRKYK